MPRRSVTPANTPRYTLSPAASGPETAESDTHANKDAKTATKKAISAYDASAGPTQVRNAGISCSRTIDFIAYL
jgi:hypothetical protein